MIQSSENIELLLRISVSLEIKETNLKKKLYNLILLRLKLYDTTSRIITESELLAEVIIKMVGQYYLLSENYYLDKTRITEYVMARYIAMKLIKLNTKSSLAKIGKMFKGKDHATVLHGINLISDLCETDKIFKMDYENLANKLELKY